MDTLPEPANTFWMDGGATTNFDETCRRMLEQFLPSEDTANCSQKNKVVYLLFKNPTENVLILFYVKREEQMFFPICLHLFNHTVDRLQGQTCLPCFHSWVGWIELTACEMEALNWNKTTILDSMPTASLCAFAVQENFSPELPPLEVVQLINTFSTGDRFPCGLKYRSLSESDVEIELWLHPPDPYAFENATRGKKKKVNTILDRAGTAREYLRSRNYEFKHKSAEKRYIESLSKHIEEMLQSEISCNSSQYWTLQICRHWKLDCGSSRWNGLLSSRLLEQGQFYLRDTGLASRLSAPQEKFKQLKEDHGSLYRNRNGDFVSGLDEAQNTELSRLITGLQKVVESLREEFLENTTNFTFQDGEDVFPLEEGLPDPDGNGQLHIMQRLTTSGEWKSHISTKKIACCKSPLSCLNECHLPLNIGAMTL